MDVFTVIPPRTTRVPIVLSSPHSGTQFPEDIAKRLKPEHVHFPDDADWFIDKLYDFAPDLGITVIQANYCRWVIDLNRDALQKPLYDDGRVITGLVPTTDFNGNSLYISSDLEPTHDEIQDRIERYYQPYHQEIERQLQDLESEFGRVLLWDCHSIRDFVPGIRQEKFPDLILGDNDGKSASTEIIQTVMNILSTGAYQVAHNQPFKGGAITRSFGNPTKNRHALQLEMIKTNYMDNAQKNYHPQRAEQMRQLLEEVFQGLIKSL